MQGFVHGTVFSGHPTATTLCNTIRVICYIRFMIKRSGIKESDYKALVSGDDVLIIMNNEKIPLFKETLSKIYIDGTEIQKGDRIVKGLGQVVKAGEFFVTKNKIDFLSKYGMIAKDGEAILNRRIERALVGSNVTEKISK